MAWFLRQMQYASGIYIASGKKFSAEESGRLVPQPEVGDLDHAQCARLPELFGWREEAAPVQPEPVPEPAKLPELVKLQEPEPVQQPVPAPAPEAVKKPARKLSKLLGG